MNKLKWHEKLSLILIILGCFIVPHLVEGQTPVVNRSWDIKIGGTTCLESPTLLCSPAENIGNRGLSAHIFTWSVQSGVPSSCSLLVQTSPDNKTTSTWTTQYTGSCLVGGTSNYLVFTANFIRVKVTPFVMQSGTGLVTVNYAGYVIPPTSIATLTTAPLQNQNINNIIYPYNYSGADACVQIYNAITATVGMSSAGSYVIDARSYTGNQTCTSSWFNGVTGVKVLVGAADFAFNVTLYVGTDDSIEGIGNASVIATLNASNPSGELVRMQGDRSSIKNVQINGSGQGDGSSVNGQRGIWLGCGVSQVLGCIVHNVLIENVDISQTKGNGVAGDCQYCSILYNRIHDTTDAAGFFQPASSDNLVQGNYLYNSRYNGWDNTGYNNRFLDNYVYNNGGGVLGSLDWNGLLDNYVSTSTTQPNAYHNIYEGNIIHDNKNCGILIVNGWATSGTNGSLFGIIISNNIVYNHNTLSFNGVTHTQWYGGICVEGANGVSVSGNISRNNLNNFIVSGNVNGQNTAIVLSHNIASESIGNVLISATTSGTNYYFPGSSRMDGVGGHPVNNLTLDGNFGFLSFKDDYRWALDGATGSNLWNGLKTIGNHSDYAGAYGFDFADPNQLLSYISIGNEATNAKTGGMTGFNPIGLTPNSTTPSVVGGQLFATNNSGSTVYTNFLSGITGQQITIKVNDANSSFNFNGTNLKGYAAITYSALNGDYVTATFDGTNWQCIVQHQGGSILGTLVNVNQATGKTTTVTQNNALFGQITLHSGNGITDIIGIGTAGTTTFNLSNNQFTTSRDTCWIQQSGGANPGFYTYSCGDNGAGLMSIAIHNTDPLNVHDDTMVLRYWIEKH